MVAETTWVETENRNMRAYYTRMAMVEQSLDCRRGSPCDSPVAELFMAIKGVEALRINPYVVFVMKAVAYSWDEVHPRVVEVVDHMNMSDRLLCNTN